MRVFSTFTGIGGFELGINNAADRSGKKVEYVGYSEIDKYAISVYEKHFKGVKNYGDITKINPADLPDFDCLVGGFPCQSFSILGQRRGRVSDVSPTLDTGMWIYTVTDDLRLRRLTPKECERLQAFPGDWTATGVNGEQFSDRQRYKMLGNAVTTNVIQAVFERILVNG